MWGRGWGIKKLMSISIEYLYKHSQQYRRLKIKLIKQWKQDHGVTTTHTIQPLDLHNLNRIAASAALLIKDITTTDNA